MENSNMALEPNNLIHPNLPFVPSKRYVCISFSRKKKGYTWFGCAEYYPPSDVKEEGSFSAMCFFPELSELDYVIDPDLIPDELWKPLAHVELSNDEHLLYTFKREPEKVRSGRYHLSTAFGRYQGYHGPYISGDPVVQVDKVIPLNDLIEYYSQN